ncbi:MAG: GNAT family N-acetyltransferase [Planctomycetia bacterium]|nr:GNAT family N-acetyltransferase [Planctomycetia bacterium]
MPRFVVTPAAPHELFPACRLLFAKHADGDRRAEHCRDRLLAESAASGVFVARDAEGKLRAATLVQALPGALGLSWAPNGDSTDAQDAVVVAANTWLRSQGVKVCQTFASADEVADMALLERHGFRHITQLVFLSRDLTGDGAALEPLTGELSLVAEGPPVSLEFESTLLATHEGTLDCPELNAPRTPAEILAGFMSSAPGEWFLVKRDREPVGVFMFEADPRQDASELTYIGVVPELRGQGFGSQLLNFAVGGAALTDASALNVSVDARNTPAMKLYARHGFIEYDRREVWLAQFNEPRPQGSG